MTRTVARGVVLPLVVGLLAVTLGGVFAFVTFADRDEEAASSDDAAGSIRTQALVHRKGSFRLDVPTDLEAKRSGRTVRLSDKGKSLVITVGPSGQGRLKQSRARLMRIVRRTYDKVELTARAPQRVDGRRALSTAGHAVNANGVKIRFVAVVVKAKPRNYAITAYTAFESDPAVVLPKVNAVVNGFEVLGRKKQK